MRERRRVATVAATVAALGLSAGLLAGCGGGNGSGAKEAGELAVTASSTPATLAAPQASGTGGAGALTVTAPPPPGTYTYAQSGTTDVKSQGKGPEPVAPKARLEVGEASSSDGGKAVTQTSFDDKGGKVVQRILYRDNAVYLVGYEATVPVVNELRTYACKPQRPVQILPAGVAPGAKWNDVVACETGQISYTATAVGTEDATLGDGSKAPAMKIDATTTINGGNVSANSAVTVWTLLTPAPPLPGRTTEKTTAKLGLNDIVRDTSSVLTSTTPS